MGWFSLWPSGAAVCATILPTVRSNRTRKGDSGLEDYGLVPALKNPGCGAPDRLIGDTVNDTVNYVADLIG